MRQTANITSVLRTGVVAFFVLTAGCSPGRRLTLSECAERWQTPQRLTTPDGRPAYVELPAAISTPNGFLLLGRPAFLWASEKEFDGPVGETALDTAQYIAQLRANHQLSGFAITPAGALPLRPPTVPEMAVPVITRGPDGVSHAVWKAIPDDSGPTDLWHAELRDSAWSTSERLYSADKLDWTSAMPAAFVTERGLNVVVSFRRGANAGIAFIRRLDGSWRITETHLRGLPSQSTALPLAGDSLLVVFAIVGDPGFRGRNGQHLHALKAAISDTVWPASRRIQWSGLDAVRWPRLYFADISRRSIDLLWAHIPEAGGPADRLIGMQSRDDGATWSAPTSLPLPVTAISLTQAQSPSGQIHIVITPPESPQGLAEMYHVERSGGSWSSVSPLPFGPTASAPRLSQTGATVLLAWSEARRAWAGDSSPIAPITKYTTLGRACGR